MKSCALALLFVTTCWGVPLEQYTPDKSDWSTFYSKPLVKNTDHTPDGINWIAREDWKEWDGTVYNATEYSKQEFADLICPGKNTIRGMRELFLEHKPFADNMLPTKAEVDNWHAIALNHVRAMVGYTEDKYKIRPDKCLHLRALWCTERASSRLWDTEKYPGTCLGSTQPHCGADFLPTKEDQQPYLPKGIDYCPKRAGSEGLFSAAKSDIPWSLKWARPLCWTIAVEGFWGGHTGPWFHRSEFGWDWTDDDSSNLNSNAGLRAKWSGTLAPNKYKSSDVTSGRNLVKVEGVNPYPRFKNVECVGIDWVNINNAANATKCYKLMTENDSCGKRFMTFNPNNSGCGCYPPETSTCVARFGANRLTWDFSPRVPSFAGLFIDPEKKLSRNALPYDGRECPNINWKTTAGDPMHCLQKIVEGKFEDCGRKFITWNVGNFGCACYPPSVETCTRSESKGRSGRQTFELEVDPTYFTNAPTVMNPSEQPSAPNTSAPTTLAPTTSAPTTSAPTNVLLSDQPTRGPSKLPSSYDPCVPLPKKKCEQKTDVCNWEQVKKMKLCMPKIVHDCTQYTTFQTCKKATSGTCIFDSVNKLCSHRCVGEYKKKKCNKITNKSKQKMICKFKILKNPCFKCHSKSVCG